MHINLPTITIKHLFSLPIRRNYCLHFFSAVSFSGYDPLIMVTFVLNALKITSYILIQNDVSVQNVKTFTIYVFSTIL